MASDLWTYMASAVMGVGVEVLFEISDFCTW